MLISACLFDFPNDTSSSSLSSIHGVCVCNWPFRDPVTSSHSLENMETLGNKAAHYSSFSPNSLYIFFSIHSSNCSVPYVLDLQSKDKMMRGSRRGCVRLRVSFVTVPVSHSFHRLMSSLRAWRSFKSDLVSWTSTVLFFFASCFWFGSPMWLNHFGIGNTLGVLHRVVLFSE